MKIGLLANYNFDFLGIFFFLCFFFSIISQELSFSITQFHNIIINSPPPSQPSSQERSSEWGSATRGATSEVTTHRLVAMPVPPTTTWSVDLPCCRGVRWGTSPANTTPSTWLVRDVTKRRLRLHWDFFFLHTYIVVM